MHQEDLQLGDTVMDTHPISNPARRGEAAGGNGPRVETARGYQRGRKEGEAVTVEYYVADALFKSFAVKFASGVTKDNLLRIPPGQLNQITSALMQTLNAQREFDTNADERHESERYIR